VATDLQSRVARSRRIIKASWIGIVGNGALAVLKLIVGFTASSLAVLSDGIDSAVDILTSCVTLVAARITAKPPDIDHPYGHSRAETIATKAFSFVIFFAGAQLALTTLGRILNGGSSPIPQAAAIYVTIVSMLGKIALSWYKARLGKKLESQMLIADARNMRADIVISAAVLVGILTTIVLELPIVDSVTALAVSAWIMWIAFKIFLDTNTELMEGHTERETYQRIFDAVEAVEGAVHPHRARIRSLGNMYIVDLDIEVDGDLSVREAHAIARRTEHRIKEVVENVYDVLVHVEPYGNVERTERFGVSQRKLDAEQDTGRRP
jgi:cation diffusion facilitator family transporter